MSVQTVERWHGTSGGYTNHRCRCDACTDAFRLKMQDYRARKLSGPCPTPGCHRKASRAEGTGYCRPCSAKRRSTA